MKLRWTLDRYPVAPKPVARKTMAGLCLKTSRDRQGAVDRMNVLITEPLPDGRGSYRTRPFKTEARGFTLIELLLVLVILATLAALVVPKFAGRGEQARVTAAKADISAMETALDTFEVDTGRYPSTQEGLAALSSAPAGLSNWRGPYLKRSVASDPWGNAYTYRYPGQRNTEGYDLYSFGPNGQEGDTDDLTNWTTP